MPVDSTVQDLDNLHRQARTARARLEPVWYLGLAYFANEQWVAWDGRQLYRPSMPKSRITVVDNRITPAVRKELARLTKSRPVFTVTPQSSDEEDANASRLGEKLLRYLWKELHMTKLDYKALEWSRICGAGFLKCYWDPTVGESTEVLVRSGGGVLQGPQGVLRPGTPHGDLALQMDPSIRVKRVARGEVRVETRSPFQMFVDPLADMFEECEWVIEESVKSRDYVRSRYGVDLEPDTPANPGLIEARMGTVFMPGTGGYKGLKVREYWCKPCATHPQGRRAVWVTTGEGKKLQGQVLLEDDAPFDPMPYVMYTGINIPGRFWPMGVVELLRGPQTELNKTRSQIAENRNRIGNPTILASKQAIQDPDKFVESTMQPGGVLFFDDVGSPNTIPKVMEAPPLPEYVTDQIPLIVESMQEISGQHEVTSAQVPPGVTAASAINLLQEADDTMLGPSVTEHEEQLARLGQKILKLVANYYTDTRMIRIGGDNGSWEIIPFRGSMLRDNDQVEVQAGSSFPASKAAKQAQMQDFLNYSAQTGNPLQGRQLAKFMQDWGVGAFSSFLEDFDQTESQINRENVLLAQGQPLPINSYDKDDEHVDGHQDFQRGGQYQQLPDVVKHIFELHVEAHRQRMAQQQQAQMQLAMQMQGNDPQVQQAQAQQQQQQAQLEQAQAQQDMQNKQQQADMQTAQAQQQMQTKDAQNAQQQGFQQAQSEQQQRQQEEQHQQELRHAEERHQLELRRSAEQAQHESARAEEQRRQQRLTAEQQRKNAAQKPNEKRSK